MVLRACASLCAQEELWCIQGTIDGAGIQTRSHWASTLLPGLSLATELVVLDFFFCPSSFSVT